ncbi:MAG: hypothetical protein ACLP9L_05390 [Thermoguttaceae bacterium]
MELKNEREAEVTRKKLRLLEERYEAIRSRPATNEHVRDLTLRSFKQTINQFKEEIIRFESGARHSRNYGDPEVTRKKLQLLEEHYETVRRKPAENEYVRELTLQSLKRFINELKEEIVCAESRSATGARGN